MKRSPMPRRRKPMNPASRRRLERRAERQVCCEQVMERDHGKCRIKLAGCLGWASDVHEIRTRARGGSIYDPENCISACRPCHTFVTDNPAWSDEYGWTIHSWDDDR